MLVISNHQSPFHLCPPAAPAPAIVPTNEHSDRGLSDREMSSGSPSFPFQGPSSTTQNSQPPLLSAGSSKRSRPKPKLSLQTSSVPRTSGKSTTGLTLSIPTGGAAPTSPTARNTFRNAYDSHRRELSPAPACALSQQPPTPTSSASSTDPTRCSGSNDNVPYELPKGVKSILRNSPLSAARQPCHLQENNPIQVGGKLQSSPKKRVAYRAPLQEEIHNVKYTARHSDLYDVSDSESDAANSSDASKPPPRFEQEARPLGKVFRNARAEDDVKPAADSKKELQSSSEKKHSASNERELIAAALRDSLPDPSYTNNQQPNPVSPTTPVCPRSKRPRQWHWTLGPIVNGQVLPAPNPDEEVDELQEADEGRDVTPPEPLTPVTPLCTSLSESFTIHDDEYTAVSGKRDHDHDNRHSKTNGSPTLRSPFPKRREMRFEHTGAATK